MKYLLSNDKDKNRLYWVKSIKSKSIEKERLQKKYNIIEDKKLFILWVTLAITNVNNAKTLIDALEWILELWATVLLIAYAESEFQKPIENLKNKFWDNLLLLENNEETERDIYSISDAVLFLRFNTQKIQNSLSYWSVPIILLSKEFDANLTKDFDPLLEKWNSFVVNWKTYWSAVEWFVRAKETFKFSYDWNLLRTNCCQSIEL